MTSHSPVILPYVENLFDIWTSSYFGITSQYDVMFDLKINVGHCNLYFMAQWFCLISWRLFDVWTSYLRIMSQYDPMFDLKIFHGPVILCYILKAVRCMTIILLDHESIWPNFLPQNKCWSLWSIFYGPVILHTILKTIWCMNIILWDYDQTFDLKINVGHCDLYFIVLWFWVISWRLWCMNIILRDYESVLPNLWPQNKCRSVWPHISRSSDFTCLI